MLAALTPLRVATLHGGSLDRAGKLLDAWTAAGWRAQLEACDVMTMTPDVLKNGLKVEAVERKKRWTKSMSFWGSEPPSCVEALT